MTTAHWLVKRLLWPARDRRDLGGVPAPGELVPRLIDDEGSPTTAAALWAALVAELPIPVESAGGGAPAADSGAASAGGAALARFTAALERAVDAGPTGDVAGVLALESAFAELARSLDGPRG
jgi:hypothetical protein